MEHIGKDNRPKQAIATDMGRAPGSLQEKVLFYSEPTRTRELIPKLEKGSSTVKEYANAFTDKMKFDLHIVPKELPMMDRYT